ncbi:hypothetical protein IU449_14270 [Nocardia higoensis]|uniref:Uncharacterized protein n=1 Tax=Nocardia higoensis TaxID=228599 RepID=A0ABS0DDM1_9NOCA|nr:hypothetical protein [Nocardia higoensis]MBF6355697.1 hypothetical protein [Nocardia higoensis]
MNIIDSATRIPGGKRSVTQSMSECEQQFDRLPAPQPDGALLGTYRGRVVAIPGITGSPTPLRRLADVTIPRMRFPWYGKSFDGSSGANVWLTSTGRFLRFRYAVHYSDSGVRLTYDVQENPALLRGLEAEIRSLAPGRYLCRAIHKGRVLLYFTLES